MIRYLFNDGIRKRERALCHVKQFMFCEREAVEHLGREYAALSFYNHTCRLIHHIGIFVDTLAHKRIIDIDDGDNLCPDWNLISFEVVRISVSVIPLVMIAADLITIIIKFIVLLLELLDRKSVV